MARKASIIEKVLRSSNKPPKILESAFQRLPDHLIPKFVEVGFDSYALSNSVFTQIERNDLKDVQFVSTSSILKKATRKQAFLYVYGIMKRNSAKVKKFVELEDYFGRALFSNNSDEAYKALDEIESLMGMSYWSVNTRTAVRCWYDKKTELKDLNIPKLNNAPYALVEFHSKLALLMHSAEDNSAQEFEEVEGMDSFLQETFKYKMYGFNSPISIDPYKVLVNETITTLTDLFKVFEYLCLELHCSDDEELVEERNIAKQFLYDVKVFDFKSISEIHLDQCNESGYLNSYTSDDYESVLSLSNDQDKYDPGVVAILSKSMYRGKFRSVQKDLFSEIANLLADVYEKQSGYVNSVNRISNICNSFPTSKFFCAIKRIVATESGMRPELGGYLQEAIGPYSKLYSPFNLSYHFSTEQIVNHIQESDVKGITSKLYLDIVSEENKSLDGSQRLLRYRAAKYLANGESNKALSLYKNNDLLQDNAAKRNYLIALCKEKELTSAAEYFVSLRRKHPEAMRYFSIDELKAILISNVFSFDSIYIPLSLYYFVENAETKLKLTATANSIKHYVKSKGVSLPADLELQGGNPDIVEFLEFVCNRDLLKKSLLFRSEKDACEERNRICTLLSTEKLGNVEKLIFESKELSKKKVFDSAAQQVSTNKVYADVDFVRTSTWESINSIYKEYIGTVEDSSVTISPQEVLKIYQKAEEEHRSRKANINKDILELISNRLNVIVEVSESNHLFYISEMLKSAISEYCFGTKGLNVYLSTRIRHGTFKSTLLGPLTITGIYSDDELYIDNPFIVSNCDGLEKSVREKILNAQKTLKDEVDDVVLDVIGRALQVRTNEKGSEGYCFDFTYSKYHVYKIFRALKGSPTLKDFWDQLSIFLTERKAVGCKLVKEQLGNEVKINIQKSVTVFQDKVSLALCDSTTTESREILDVVDKAKRGVLSQLNVILGWFDSYSYESEGDVGFDVAVEIAKTMIGIDQVKAFDEVGATIPYSLLSPFVDIIYNLLSNAVKHSGVEPSALAITVSLCNSNGSHLLVADNNCSENLGYEEKNKKLEEKTSALYSLSDEQVNSLLQSEGGTGIVKVINFLRNDLRSEGVIRMRYADEYTFRTEVELYKDLLVKS